MRPALAFAAALLLAPGLAQAGETLDRVLSTKVLNNVVVDNYPPFTFIDKDNQLAGFDIDVAQAVGDKLGVKVVNSVPGWEVITAGRWAKRWDVCICSITPTTDRATVLDFIVQYYSSPAVLIVHKDETAIKSVADISGKQVGVGSGSSYEAYLDKTITIPGEKTIAFPFNDPIKVPSNETVNFQNLALGPGVRLDAIVANIATAKGLIDAGAPLKIVGEPLFGEPNWIAVDKGDAEWNAKVVETIEALRADGTLKAISEKWLGTDITRNDI
ncbi:amino acid ABC transporter substrate-binding protein [Kaistia sp. 32K]|nr:amino acid ABC transporter substrate-binding protein [Kaistia sp. 32K]